MVPYLLGASTSIFRYLNSKLDFSLNNTDNYQSICTAYVNYCPQLYRKTQYKALGPIIFIVGIQ